MSLRLAVVGAHLSGLPLNHQLTDLGAKLLQSARTAPVYRMYDLGPKPALIRQQKDAEGFEIELEVWEVPLDKVGCFLRCAHGWALAARARRPSPCSACRRGQRRLPRKCVARSQ